MESPEHTRLSSFEIESMPDPGRHKQGRPTRRFKWLAVVLLVVCLTGGVFLYTRLPNFLHAHSQITNVTKHQSGWCVSTEVAGNSSFELLHLTAISPASVWAFGQETQGSSDLIQLMPLMEHWNGSQWSMVPTADTTPLLDSLQIMLPNPRSEIVSLNSLSVVSADDIWAVGFVRAWKGLLSGDSFSLTLIEHWNGSQWQLVDSPDGTSQGFNALSSVVAISANDVWAVGNSAPPAASATATPLVEHWDGRSWSIIQLPTSLHVETLNGITATSTNDIWAVGNSASSTNASQSVPLAIHWNGQSWSAATLPPDTLPPDLNGDGFFIVKAISADDVWAILDSVGTKSRPNPPQILIHWDGQQWSRVGQINGVPSGSNFWGITGDNAHNVWVVGDTPVPGKPASVTQPFIVHWNGRSWNRVALPDMPYGSLTDVASVGGKLWILGESYDSRGKPLRTLIETTC